MIFDKATLLERVEGDEQLASELVEMFLESCPKLLDDVRQAVKARNAASLERAAHALKGSAGDIAAPLAFETARAMEQLAREKNLEDAGTTLKSVELALHLLMQELRGLQMKAV
jgi:two-component system, sensor histidine kinase and response regulator